MARYYPEGCCSACYYAKSKRCRCTCGGLYHGLGRVGEVNNDLSKYSQEGHEIKIVSVYGAKQK